MDNNMEYHDPDYPGTSKSSLSESPKITIEEKFEKLKQILHREFSNELDVRENEVMVIDQRMSTSRRMLHRIRYALVSKYYQDQKLQLSSSVIQDEISAQSEPRARNEVSAILREGQKRLHPSVRKLLGKQTVDLEDIFKSRAPRNKIRKNYMAMVGTRNYTIAADTTKSLRPDKDTDIQPEEPSTSKPKKVPRHFDPKITNVVTLDEATRNKMKYRYRIVIGNTSKYAPAASGADRSTHKWLLYVRALNPAHPLQLIITSMTVTLHHSYAPHHILHIAKPPFHISRRGWGEFPAQVELHFALPHRNRPATVEHTIKLDRNYTGLQTLGAETIVDVWLYSTEEMMKYSYKDEDENIPYNPTPEIEQEIKQEPTENIEYDAIKTEPQDLQFDDTQTDWMDFFSKDTKMDVDDLIIKPIKTEKDFEVPVTSPKKRIMKYIDPTTGKIYYLEMDRTLDLSTVQEIVINDGEIKTAKISPVKANGLKHVRKKKGVSLLKPEVQSLLNENKERGTNFSHIENDHCYLGLPWKTQEGNDEDSFKEISRLNSVRVAVSYLLKKIPLITEKAKDPDYLVKYPFVVESSEKYWKLDFAKRRNIEWSRAKLINRTISKYFEQTWRTKQILLYSRLHGYYPIRIDTAKCDDTYYTEQINVNINTLSLFNKNDYKIEDEITIDSDEEIEVVKTENRRVFKRVSEKEVELNVIPVECEEDRLRFLYVERVCGDLGVVLKNEDVGHGCSYSAVHSVVLSAMKSFAEELIRGALAAKLTEDHADSLPAVWRGSACNTVGLSHVLAATSSSRLQLLSRRGLATKKNDYTTL